MKFTSIIAIYALFFAATAFALLPFGVKTAEEAGDLIVPGQAESAPHAFNLPRHLLKSAAVAALLFGLYYANWSQGWVTIEDLDFYN